MKKLESTELTNFTYEPFKKEIYAETKLKIKLLVSDFETHSFSLYAKSSDNGGEIVDTDEDPILISLNLLANYGISQHGGSEFLHAGFHNIKFLCDGEQVEPFSSIETLSKKGKVKGGPHVVNFQREYRFLFETSELVKIAEAQTLQARGYSARDPFDFEQTFLDQLQSLVRVYLYDVLKHPIPTGDYQSHVDKLLKLQNESRRPTGLFGFLKRLF